MISGLLLLALAAGDRISGSAPVWVWNTSDTPVPITCPDGTCSGGGGSGGGSVYVDGGVLACTQSGPWSVAVNNLPATQPVSIASMPSTPVTGTFWQSTQPVSIASMPSTPVTGTFWQSTQPVSIASMPSTPVTGTFWQSTQPVSIASMPSTPVTGTFWQATQPVSLASAPTTAVTQAAGSISGSNPCQNPTATITGISGSTSGTSAVQIVALSGSTKIYICSLIVTGVSGTSPTFSLVTGTGSNCGTGQAVLIGSWTTAANTLYNFSASTVAIGPAGAALCYLDTGTTPVQRYALTYVQQ